MITMIVVVVMVVMVVGLCHGVCPDRAEAAGRRAAAAGWLATGLAARLAARRLRPLGTLLLRGGNRGHRCGQGTIQATGPEAGRQPQTEHLVMEKVCQKTESVRLCSGQGAVQAAAGPSGRWQPQARNLQRLTGSD